MALSPMFRQYQALKKDHPGSILLFRMGDFYEMFHEDARVASRLLELTLTARGKGTENVVPMCGFPHHQLENYTARLVRADQRVAICDQVEDPRKTKGLVRREVVRTVTPGTVIDPNQLEAKENSWMGALSLVGNRPGAAFLDLSTGEFIVWEPPDTGEPAWERLADCLRGFAPREIVIPESFAWPDPGFASSRVGRTLLTETDPYAFSPNAAEPLLKTQFGVASLDGFGLRHRASATAAAGGLLQYLKDTQKCGLEHIVELSVHEPSSHLLLDPATHRNLELSHSLRDGKRQGSLIHAIDQTVTPAAGRLLRRWILAPLLEVEPIAARHDAVQEFFMRSEVRGRARADLSGVHDVERLLARVVAGTANARDLIGLRESLSRLPHLIERLSDIVAPLSRGILDGLDPCTDLAERLSAALMDEPAANLREGGFIRDGFNAELDELRAISKDGKSYIASLEAKERETTGINSLKVRFNKVFGYYIEVSKTNLHLAPERYHRKQTVATGERFVTPELKEYEGKVLHAQERIADLELELFQELRREIAGHAPRLKAVARATAEIDVLAGLAEAAALHDYRRPRVHEGEGLRIVGGRHPVVEQSLTTERFVPNDTDLTAGAAAIAVLTGPNMGGKSTYLRQVAQIVLLAQAGSFVPAKTAEIGVVDRIFCRVGASDSLSEGQSTFMVEMTETANILRNAGTRSLLLLDEIGRGTSTFDGLSIAWAVVESLHAVPGGAPRTLFATHYHELTELAVELDGILNLRMAVKEWDDGVIFTHRVETGASDRSYGIQVARLAGVPAPVVDRAREILTNLEQDEYGRDGLPRRARREGEPPRRAQTTLFGIFEPEPSPAPGTQPYTPAGSEGISEVISDIGGEIRDQDLDRLTPMDALNLLADWKRRLKPER